MFEGKKPAVLFVCGDPGGAMAVTPVMEALVSDGLVLVQALAYGETVDVWAAKGMPFGELAEGLTYEHILAKLQTLNPCLVVTGTSINAEEYEKVCIAAAQELGIPSLAVLDFWANYRYRFSDGNDNFCYLPDKIAIMDQLAFDEMAAAGFPTDRLQITGQPAFDDLTVVRDGFSNRSETRKQLAIADEDLMVVFYSQPFSALFGSDERSANYPGYDEFSALKGLLHALEEIALRTGRIIHLVIAPHMREALEKFAQVKGKHVRVVVDNTIDSRHLTLSANLVTGMTSTRLVEACYLRQVVLSLQPGLNKEDTLFINRQGFAIGVYDEEDISAKVSMYLLNEVDKKAQIERLKAFSASPNATQQVKEFIYKMIDQHEICFNRGANHKTNHRRIPC